MIRFFFSRLPQAHSIMKTMHFRIFFLWEILVFFYAHNFAVYSIELDFGRLNRDAIVEEEKQERKKKSINYISIAMAMAQRQWLY